MIIFLYCLYSITCFVQCTPVVPLTLFFFVLYSYMFQILRRPDKNPLNSLLLDDANDLDASKLFLFWPFPCVCPTSYVPFFVHSGFLTGLTQCDPNICLPAGFCRITVPRLWSRWYVVTPKALFGFVIDKQAIHLVVRDAFLYLHLPLCFRCVLRQMRFVTEILLFPPISSPH